jgi:glycosyltransferase involved in cell wall biosynthesis
LAINAVAKVRSIVKKYVIVGEGPERDKLRHLIKSLELEETVQLVGWADDITPYLHDADVALVPSRWEGFGLVAVEALSCGLPIIATDVPGLNEVVNGCPAVWKVSPESVAELVETLFEVHKKLTEGLSVARAARKQAELFTLDNMVGRYYEVYRKILKNYTLQT